MHTRWKKSDKDGIVPFLVGKNVIKQLWVSTWRLGGEEHLVATIDNPEFPMTVTLTER